MTAQMMASDLLRVLAPELLLVAGAMVLLLASVWHPQGQAADGAEGAERTVAMARYGMVLCALVGLVVTIAWGDGVGGSADGRLAADGFRFTMDLVLLGAAALGMALMEVDHGRFRGYGPEVPALMLLALSGMMVLAAARDLLFVFLGIELMSLAVYVLAGVQRRSARGTEAAIKYFLLGSIASAFLLYGIALLFGATGSTRLGDIARWIADHPAGGGLVPAGLGLLLVGLAFKVAAAPFHVWTPDVYEGAPPPVTAFMATGVKAAAFATLARTLLEAFPGAVPLWHPVLWWLAVLTMLTGNVLALAQRRVVRTLAYSSIAHAGYLLVALVSASSAGAAAVAFYLVTYTLATMGTFAVLVVARPGDDRPLEIADLAGLWLVRPGLASGLAVFLLAFMGMPLVGGAGFFAKWLVLQSALQASSPQHVLAVILALTSFVSAGYYLSVVGTMFLRPRPDQAPIIRVPALASGVVLACAVTLLGLGLYPSPLITLARRATIMTEQGASAKAAPSVPPAAGWRAAAAR
jgi:NADH-quinone oxidoreductase subunit N